MILSEEFLSFCNQHENDDVYNLALQASRYPNIDVPQAIQQIKGRQIAKKKLPLWYSNQKIIYPKHLSLEQCSSEHTALYKQSLYEPGGKMIDLTGGMGVDTSFLSRSFQKAVYVEKQAELTQLARHNFVSLGLKNIQIVNSDAVEYLKAIEEKVDLIYLDPARRDNKGSKTVFIEDCVPNVLEIQKELEMKGKSIMIKMSPMLDISLALSKLKNVSEVHIVSVNNDCKELLFIINNGDRNPRIQKRCINIHSAKNDEVFIFSEGEEELAIVQYASDVDKFLYEPNASVMKSGAFNLISERYDIRKLHKNSHLYTSSHCVDNFPGKRFVVQSVIPYKEKSLKRNLSTVDNLNIVVRNFPISVDQLRKKIYKKDGGNNFLFATTIADDKRVLILCERN